MKLLHKHNLFNTYLLRLLVTLCCAGLSACSSMGSAMDKIKNVDLWPFDDGPSSNEQVRTYRPANSTEYLCDKSKRFFIRQLDKGESVWLITKEREIALPKTAAGEYAIDTVKLSLGKDGAELKMSAETLYTNCKIVPIK